MMIAQPLAGARIAVTRASHQAPPLADLIREFGAAPILYPCIAITSPDDLRPLDDCLRRVRHFDWLLVTSGNAVRAVAERLSALELSLTGASIRVAAAGPATADELQRRLDLEARFLPTDYGAEELARSLPISQPCRVLMPQSNLADESTAQILRARGADLRTVVAYRTVIGEGGADLRALIGRAEIDALTFTSPSAVSFFCRRCPVCAARQLPAACIGPATAARAATHGFQRLVTPKRASLRAMISALAAHFESA
ncbi:MAG: uroporphyrinogen-III synthase [Chloroflexi bacterium]|nr:uroporphyrinogen-III synthase [Chloroflexota bacterium]